MIPPSKSAGESTPIDSIRWDSSWPKWVKSPERNQLLGFLQERFGIPQSIFTNQHLLKRGATVWLLTRDERLSGLASLSVETVGVPILRWVGERLKPTSAALQLFGKYVTKNIVSLEPIQLAELIGKREIRGEYPVSPGYVQIMTESIIIGCGLYLPGRLISQFPRHMFANQTWEYQGISRLE